MAHILARKYGPGATRYAAVVRIRKGAFVVHRESKTFAHRSAALTWTKHREVELENPSKRATAHHGAPTLAELIRRYIDSFETVSKWQRSKQTHLEFLERHTLGECEALSLTWRRALTQPDRLQRFTSLDVLSQGAPNLSDESPSILRIAQHLRALRPLRVRQVPASSGCAPRGLLRIDRGIADHLGGSSTLLEEFLLLNHPAIAERLDGPLGRPGEGAAPIRR